MTSPISQLRKTAEWRYVFTERLYILMEERAGDATESEMLMATQCADEHMVSLEMATQTA